MGLTIVKILSNCSKYCLDLDQEVFFSVLGSWYVLEKQYRII